MSGFIYIWKDKKTKKYYIGSHWGDKDDNYICSSPSMREAHRRRPHDFKRRIISYILTNRIDLLAEEQRWLLMIQPKDFGIKYYNISSSVKTPVWWMNEESRQQVSQKVSATIKAKWTNPIYRNKCVNAAKKRHKEGKHHFTSEFATQRNLKWAANGIHPFQGLAKKFIKQGRHPTQMMRTCPHCGFTGNSGNLGRYHFDKCKEKNNENNRTNPRRN